MATKAQIAAAALDIDASHDEALARPDPADGLRLAARIQRRQYELMYDVIAIYQEAARTDPDIAGDLRVITANRERAFRRHVESIAGHLSPGVTVDEGVDRYLAVVLPEVYRTLVLERGWSIDQYETWLADTLLQQLLATRKLPAVAPRPSRRQPARRGCQARAGMISSP